MRRPGEPQKIGGQATGMLMILTGARHCCDDNHTTGYLYRKSLEKLRSFQASW